MNAGRRLVAEGRLPALSRPELPHNQTLQTDDPRPSPSRGRRPLGLRASRLEEVGLRRLATDAFLSSNLFSADRR